MRYYQDELDDYCMKHNRCLPRYSGLALKAISHYLGDQYNPWTFNANVELMFRQFIRGYIKLKIFNKEPYDWPFIDNFFRKVIYDEGFTHIPYNQFIIDKGYNGIIRSELPKYRA